MPRLHKARLLFVAIALSFAACSGDKEASVANGSGLYNPDALPTGPVGQAIRNGYAIITNTPTEAKGFVRADMSCAACHIAGGTVPHGGSLAGTLANFPQWNVRAKRVITLEDRIAECFLYSMNGRPPKYAGKQMVSLVAYIAWLSRGSSHSIGLGRPKQFHGCAAFGDARRRSRQEHLSPKMRGLPSDQRSRDKRNVSTIVGSDVVQ